MEYCTVCGQTGATEDHVCECRQAEHYSSLIFQVRALQLENNLMRKVLREMANEDYRGNRNPLSVKAFKALLELDAVASKAVAKE